VLDPAALPEDVLGFLGERHLATLTTLRPDGSPHVVAVGFTWDGDAGLARVISFAPSRKARNLVAAPGSRAAVCQVDGGRWLTLEGPATATDDPDRVDKGVRR
jgi:PPOX class probable F420-dependent enzyme